MSFAKFIVIQPGYATREVLLDRGLVTIGRALDNTISLEDDSNVSRYHAEIEKRGEEFWVSDLGSSNGTTVNDVVVELDQPLQNGDLIGVGGSTIIEFHLSNTPWVTEEKRYAQAPTELPPQAPISDPQVHVFDQAPVNLPINPGNEISNVAAAATQPIPAPVSSGLSPLVLIGAIGGGLLLTGAVAAIFLLGSAGGCKASVHIVSPQTGTTIKGPIAIRVEAEETECIDRVIYELDGVKVASSEIPPYKAMLDPAELSGLAGNHILTVTVEDDKGNRRIQPDEVVLGFESAQLQPPDSNPSPGSPSDIVNQRNGEPSQNLSTSDIKDMCEKLAREVSRKEGYIFDRELLHQVEARTREYAVPGFHNRARPFRDVINDSFINEMGLDPPLGFLVAMSRSNFNLSPGRSETGVQGEGLWRFPLPLAQSTGHIGRCKTPRLADQDQKCAAMVAAAYMKSLVVDLFSGDAVLAVACFGMTPNEAGQWRDQLPPDRRDLWKVINLPEQREKLIRFFAAGIVGENPQQFGLTSDSPLSTLYVK
ncbi:MAG TPA: hypothetical protein DCK93_06420 [Blastocatellia bacterium]|jgi:hypothetical protein|nr:hypothetical protein [Blastocatellia bacterium]